MSDFLDYALSLNPGLFHAYVQGHLHDLSGHGVASTFVGTPRWMRSRHGHLLHAGAAGNLQLGDPASCRAATHLVIMAFGDFAQLEANGRIVAKRSGALAATCDYDLFLTSTPAISLFDGVTTSTLNIDYRGAFSIAARVADGIVPSFFVDGVWVGVGSAVLDVDDDGNTLYVLGREGGADRLQASLGALLIFVDTAITEEQISDLHRLYIEDARGVPTAPARTISFPKRDLNNALLYLAGSKNAAGDVVDYSGNGLDAAVTGRVGEQREHVSGAQVQRFHGAGQGVVTVPASALLTGHVGQTYSGLVRIDGDGEAGGGRILSTDIGGVVNTELLTRNANDLRFSRLYADGQADWDVAVRPDNGLPYHLVARHDGDPTHLPTGLINGRAMAFAVSTGRTGALTSDVGADTKFGNRDALDRTLNGVVSSAKLHGAALTDEQARAEYLQHATRAIELAPRRAYPVTLANVTAGRVGPWDRISGTWSYWDDGTRRQLVNVAGGICAVPSDQAYGARYMRISKADSSGDYFMCVASCRGAPNLATQSGYFLYLHSTEAVQFYRVTNGVSTYLFGTGVGFISANIEYEFMITRTLDGYFVIWIRGGTFTTWTEILNGIDNTHTISRFMVVGFDAGSYISDVIYYPLGDTLDPRTEVPGLED